MSWSENAPVRTLAHLFDERGVRRLDVNHSPARPAVANMILINQRTGLRAASVALRHDQVIQVIEMLMSCARLGSMGIDSRLSASLTAESSVRVENAGKAVTLVLVGPYELGSGEMKQGGSALFRFTEANRLQLLNGLQEAARLTHTDALRRRDLEQHS